MKQSSAVLVPYETRIGDGQVSVVIAAGAAKGCGISFKESAVPAEDRLQAMLLKMTEDEEGHRFPNREDNWMYRKER